MYLFPSRSTSRSELSGESDTDESLKQSSKKRKKKKKKKKHHHYKKAKKKTRGDSSNTESDVDIKDIKDKGAASCRNHKRGAAAKYVFITTMKDVNSLYSCTWYSSLQLYE